MWKIRAEMDGKTPMFFQYQVFAGEHRCSPSQLLSEGAAVTLAGQVEVDRAVVQAVNAASWVSEEMGVPKSHRAKLAQAVRQATYNLDCYPAAEGRRRAMLLWVEYCDYCATLKPVSLRVVKVKGYTDYRGRLIAAYSRSMPRKKSLK